MRPVSPVALLLSAWLGAAILMAGVVAPAAFAVLPSRTLAGEMVGRVLPVVFIAGMVVGLGSLWLDRGEVGRGLRVRRVATTLLVVSCAAAQFVVTPRIDEIRRGIGGPIEQVATDDPRRVAFGRLHAVSVAWLGLAMLSAATTIALISMAPRRRTAPAAEPMLAAPR